MTDTMLSFFIGTREAKNLEPLIGISDWLDAKVGASMIGIVPRCQL